MTVYGPSGAQIALDSSVDHGDVESHNLGVRTHSGF